MDRSRSNLTAVGTLAVEKSFETHQILVVHAVNVRSYDGEILHALGW